MTEHTLKPYETDLRTIEAAVMDMGSRSLGMLHDALHSVFEDDPALAQFTIDADPTINRQELEIENLAIRLLAKFQPVAEDLRFITAALKVSSSLERVADHAVNIAEQMLRHASEGPIQSSHLKEMAGKVENMLAQSLQALNTRDLALAQRVCAEDDAVDALYATAFNDLSALLSENAQGAVGIVRLMFVARYLERVADHATNIAERTIYVLRGVLASSSTHAAEP
jgi:phosphate transport system protein